MVRGKLDSYCNAVENLNLTLTLNDKNEVDSRSANFENLPNDVQQALKDVWNELSTFRPLCAQREVRPASMPSMIIAKILLKRLS